MLTGKSVPLHVLAASEMMEVVLEKREFKDIVIPDVRCYIKRTRRRTSPVGWGMQSGKKRPCHDMIMLERPLPGQDCSAFQLSPSPEDMYTYNWP